MKEENKRLCLILIGILGISTVFLSGCLEVPRYSFSLEKVERPKETRERYGEKENIFMEENKYGYEDGLIKIVFFPTTRKIDFSIRNKTSHSIKIIWDEAAYIDEDNSSHRVMHYGVKFISRNEPQAPGVVAAGGTLEDMVYPTDYVYYSNGWEQRSLFPNTGRRFSETETEYENRITSFSGKRFGILFPLQIEGVTNEYTFIFRIRAWVQK